MADIKNLEEFVELTNNYLEDSLELQVPTLVLSRPTGDEKHNYIASFMSFDTLRRGVMARDRKSAVNLNNEEWELH